MSLIEPVSESTTFSPWDRLRWRVSAPNLRLTPSERRLILAVIDGLVLNVALLAALVLREDFSISRAFIYQNPLYFVLLTVLWVVWAAFFDCYELPRTADASQSAWRAGGAAFLTALAYLAIPHLTPHFPASRLSSVLFVSLVTVSVPVWRVLYATIFTQPTFQQRLLIVGAGRSGREMAQELACRPKRGNPYAGSGYQMIGFVDDDLVKEGTIVEGMPVLGSRHDLLRLVEEHGIDLLVVAITDPPRVCPELFQILLDCRERGIALESMVSLYERFTGKVSVEHAGRNLYVVMPQTNSPVMHLFWAGKRLLDIFAGTCGLVALTLIAPFVALANAIWSPGPLFYRQVRVGKGGKAFQMFKFRSMIPAAEKGSGAVWAREDDDRITPVGRFLRLSRLDELPQFWNVLKGEMSLIGPRPERPEFVSQLIEEVPFYQARHAVRPGLTGWAQVRYRYGCSVKDALVKLQYDLYYIKRQSVYLELSIMVKTVTVVLGLKGR